MENKPTTVAVKDIVGEASSMTAYWWSLRNMLLVFLIIANGIAILFFWQQKHSYESEVSFILEEKAAGAGGNISGLASQFGIDLGSIGGGGGIFSGDNILDILRSRHIVEKVLVSKLDSNKGALSETLADIYLPLLRKKLPTVDFNNCVYGKPYTRLQDSVLYLMYDKIVQKNLLVDRLNKKGSIIQVTVHTEKENFSKIFSDRLVYETIQLYVNQKTSVSTKNIDRLERRADSLLRLLNNKSYQSANLQILDANAAYKSSVVPVELSQREKSITFALFSEVVKNLEASRMGLASQTPVINLLDSAKYPLVDRKTPLYLLLAGATVAVFALSLIIAFFFYPSKK